MALHNAAGMYNGSAPLNPLPYVQIAMAARQRKAAREEAIDKYYRQLPDTINDKNLRDQEVPIINDYKNKIFEFGLKNREALRNPKLDNGAAQLTLDKLMRETTSVARESQNAAKVDLTAGKSLMNKDNQFILNSDEYVADHALHNLPVTDPRHKTLDLTKYAAGRPYDEGALIKRNADIKYSDGTPEISQHPTDPLSQVVTTRPVLDAANKQVLFARAADDLHNNPMFAKKIKNELAQTGQLPQLVKIAQEQFGLKDPSDITDEHLAAAYEYSLLPVKQTVQKRIVNTEAVMDKRRKEGMEDWRTKNALTFKQSLEKIRLNNQNRKDGLPTEDTGYVSDEVADQAGQDITVDLGGKKRDVRVIYVNDVDPERLDIITGKDLTKKKIGVTPIQIKQPDGTYKYGYYQDKGTGDWEGADGQKISREAVKDRYISKVSPTKFKVQVGTKGSENTNTPKVKTTTKSGLPVFH
ncbi:MAG: hypothetical protein V4538_15280 [Bacteroidota bacterium]